MTEIIKAMSKSCNRFVRNPKKDFTRNRKLNFHEMLKIILSMGCSALNSELLEYFNYEEKTATASAFVQQRAKILPSAFEYILHKFTGSFEDMKTFESFRLFAVDGSSLNIAHNPDDADTYFEPKVSKGFNQLHLNAMYDLCNKLYVDAVVQPRRKMHEYRALCDMVDRSSIDGKVIVIADRGYESYNVFAHIEQKNWYYIIRLRDSNTCSLVSGLELPNEKEFDISVSLILTKKQTSEVKSHPDIYKFLPINATFDYLDLHENKFYPMSFRVVRFKVSDDFYETVITNLDAFTFPPEKLKTLYSIRWGIETSFRELKYTVGMACFHSKKADFVYQEIFARITMYNFYELITVNIVVAKKNAKHDYQVNFSAAVQICRQFFRSSKRLPVEKLILKYILPVRWERQYLRRYTAKSFVSFNYRFA